MALFTKHNGKVVLPNSFTLRTHKMDIACVKLHVQAEWNRDFSPLQPLWLWGLFYLFIES
ncbi:hypothetical protein ACT8ZS_34525 [Paenibacillus sp. M.A.Huq-84]